MTPGGGRVARAWAALLWLLLVAVLVAVVAGGTCLGAQEVVRGGGVPREARDIIGETMSPYCPGLLLANCPSPAADTLRRAITARVVAGDTREQIEADLLATYGDQVRAAPPATGLGLVAWTAPFVVLLGAGTWIAYWVRRRVLDRSRGVAPASRAVPDLVRTGGGIPDAGEAERLRRLASLVQLDSH